MLTDLGPLVAHAARVKPLAMMAQRAPGQPIIAERLKRRRGPLQARRPIRILRTGSGHHPAQRLPRAP
eukprot:10196821-Lingulodinium_polyedra.AAC.1